MAFIFRHKLNEFVRKVVSRNTCLIFSRELIAQRLCFHSSAFLNVIGQEIKMPSLSPTMTEGTIVKWMKKEGDTIVPGDVLCEIQTDKAVVSFETEDEGVLAKILVDENTKDIKVGTLIALMVSDEENWREVELPTTSNLSNSQPRSDLGVSGTNIIMPSLSPTMTTGTIIKWHKKEGDIISPGDVLCDIQTDKAVMSFETEEEGILAKILVSEGSVDINVGTLIAVMVGKDDDWKSVQVSEQSERKESVSSSPNLTSSGSVPGLSICMPSLSPTMTEGTIIKWHKKEGDTIIPGDVLCDIQTDKAVISFETEEEGILAKILIEENSQGIKVGTLIALMVAEGENWKDVIVPSVSVSSEKKSLETDQTSKSKSAKENYQVYSNYGPAVRILLGLYQLDPAVLIPTGKNKKLLKSDVLNYINIHKLQPKPPISVPLPGTKKPQETTSEQMPLQRPIKQKYIDIELSSMRKTIAKRLTESKVSIPHAYATMECNIDVLLSFRKQLKQGGVIVSINDFVVKAVAAALKECPYVNCLYMNDEVITAPSIDVSVAVATNSGLITPIIKNTDLKSVDEISAEIRELASRARVGKLQLHEFQGGTFTISNLGMFGISEFSAIINPPQCGILAVGGGRSDIDINGKSITKMTSTLSYDARAISETAAADFLETLQILLQNPASILLNRTNNRVKASA